MILYALVSILTIVSITKFIYFAPSLSSTLQIDMEPTNLGYSTKNIPTAQPNVYLRCLIEKTQSFLQRMRWKAHHFLNPTDSPTQKETFGFKTTNSPPPIAELHDFEERMLTLVQNIEFQQTNSTFQNKLLKDIRNIKKDNDLFVPADKTTNFYRVKPESYQQLLHTNITKTYKKAPPNNTAEIIKEERKIAKDLKLDNRIDALAEKECFITLKDHKPNFNNNPTSRLINPAKSEIGIISKKILERINNKIVSVTGAKQWKNSDSVIEWFKNIPNKSSHSFISFDVVEFYPSITDDLLNKALTFASEFEEITEKERHIIVQAKNSLLFNETEAWRKKDSSSNFDVTMGSFDGAETCELVGSYLLSQLPTAYRNNIGLYRDDGLSAFNVSPRTMEIIKKEICQVFNDNKLKLTIEANKKCVNFLDITFDLRSGTYKPYTKPGNTPQYINIHSNHPPSILRRIPETINRRLSKISSNKQSFDSSTHPYQEALKKSGFNYNLHYEPQPAQKSHNRSRNITWYNPPYSSNVSTDIGHKFLKAIDESFPKKHPLNKIFNRNTLKLSYSCMPNVQSTISTHNKTILNKEANKNTAPERKCNCRQRDTCPLKGECQTKGVVYQATVTNASTKEEQTYVGLTETTFKTRYLNHTSSFRNKTKKHATELSKHIWKLKDSTTPYTINWKIIKKSKPYSNKTKRCNLCLFEKFIIICHPELSSLNKRNELISTCRHRKKYLLS